MKNHLQKQRSIPKQSDITISPSGEVCVSFLWDDIKEKTDEASPASIIEHEFPDLTLSNIFLKLQSELSDVEYANCRMCPKECGFDRLNKAHPRCGDSQLSIGTWGLSLGDEPEIAGVKGSGTILLSHCPMKCPSCHNPEMVAQGHRSSLHDVIEICYTLLEWGAENIQFLSPTVHMAKLIPILTFLKSNRFPIPLILKSSGIENLDYLRQLAGLVDIYLPDFKYGPNSEFAKRSGFKNYFELAQENIHEMIRQVGPPKYKNKQTSGEVQDRQPPICLSSGVLIRHVKAPIPEQERQHIIDFLGSVKEVALISITDNFNNME